MKIKELLIKKSETFYFVALGLGYLSFSWLGLTDSARACVEQFDKYRYIFSAFFILLRYFSLWLTKKKYIYSISPFLIIFFISAYTSRSIYLLQIVVMLFGAYKISFKKLIKFTFVFFIFTFIMLFILIYTDNITIITAEHRGGLRNYLGFRHPSYFSITILSMLMIAFYLYGSKNILVSYIVIELIALLLFYIPRTLSSSLLLFVFPLIHQVSKILIKKNCTLFNKLLIYSPIIMMIFSLLLMFLFGNRTETSFDYRFYYALCQYKEIGFNLFKSSRIWLDNTYLFLILYFGIISATAYEIILVITMKKCLLTKNTFLLAITIFFIIYGIMDNYGMNFRYNISLLALVASIDTQKKINNNENELLK